jgi:hypothetical protein
VSDVAPGILRPHPVSRAAHGVHLLKAFAARGARGTLALHFTLEGVESLLKIPAKVAARRADGLWRHTCFEAFIALPGGVYFELNFSPSTEWAVYRFDSYRHGMTAIELRADPRIDVKATANGLELQAALDLGASPDLEPIAARGSGELRAGLAAMIEAPGGELSWWALHHPDAKPDFHHPESFTLRL